MFEGIMNRINVSWSLMKKSYDVLMLDKELLIFPLIAGFFSLLAAISFFVPLFLLNLIETPLTYIGIFAFYFVTYFISIFFNSALVGAANIRLKGGDPTVSDGLRIAFDNIISIIGWSLIASTVGLILNMLAGKSKNNLIGRIIIGLLGAAWTVLTFFVIPVMIIEKQGPIKSLFKSKDLAINKFGELVVGRLGFGLIIMIINAVILIPLIILTALGFMVAGPLAIVGGVALFLILAVAVNLVSSALNSIFVTALYYYATTNKDPANWNLGEVIKSIK